MSRIHGKHAMKNRRIIRNKGKHMKTATIKINKGIVLTISFILLSSVMFTSAYLMNKNSNSNKFTIGKVETKVIETFDKKNKIKQNVYFKNTGNVSSYIRATIIICWKDDNGKILETKPVKDLDYSIKFSNSNNWIYSTDDNYYYQMPIETQEDTDILIQECKQIKEYDNKSLEVSIAVQAIQANPEKAIEESWNVEIVDRILKIKE